jgi:hypothetical protein
MSLNAIARSAALSGRDSLPLRFPGLRAFGASRYLRRFL